MPLLDFANPITTISNTSWTVTEDCYIFGIGGISTSSSDQNFTINGTNVGTMRSGNGGQICFRLKSGDTISYSGGVGGNFKAYRTR